MSTTPEPTVADPANDRLLTIPVELRLMIYEWMFSTQESLLTLQQA